MAIALRPDNEALRVTANARLTLHRLGDAAPRRLEAVTRELKVIASRVAQIVARTRQRLSGATP